MNIPVMPEIPARMKKFPLWKNRFPIFYTVMTMEDGTPNFRVVSRKRQVEASEKNLCHLCGERLEGVVYFIGSKEDLAEHYSGDGPMHLDCAEYAAKACPWLSNPDGVLRGVNYTSNKVYTELIKEIKGQPRPAEMGIVGSRRYVADLRSQYPIFIFGDVVYEDWNIIPTRKE